MIHHWQSFLIALQFLTTIPFRLSEPVTPYNQGYSLVYYPLIGLIIASVLLLSIFIFGDQSPWIAAILTLTVWVSLTGGLHLDGLADSADAWLGGLGNKEKTLAIMKDPASGPIAVVALIMILLIKLIMLVELIQQQQWIGIITAVVLARTALPLLLLTTPYVRQGGIGQVLVTHLPQRSVRIMLSLVATIAFILLGLIPIILILSLFLLLRYVMIKRLDGSTGDTAGAMVELLETSILILLVIF
jgi:adenosylcobinamide-GDP ribazoletransferase